MAEYIDRDALMKFPIRKDHCDKKNANEHFIMGIESVLEYAQCLPKADVAEVRHGEWVNPSKNPSCTNKDFFSDCNICGFTQMDETTYCPNCGADMRGGKNE